MVLYYICAWCLLLEVKGSNIINSIFSLIQQLSLAGPPGQITHRATQTAKRPGSDIVTTAAINCLVEEILMDME